MCTSRRRIPRLSSRWETAPSTAACLREAMRSRVRSNDTSRWMSASPAARRVRLRSSRPWQSFEKGKSPSQPLHLHRSWFGARKTRSPSPRLAQTGYRLAGESLFLAARNPQNFGIYDRPDAAAPVQQHQHSSPTPIGSVVAHIDQRLILTPIEPHAGKLQDTDGRRRVLCEVGWREFGRDRPKGDLRLFQFSVRDKPIGHPEVKLGLQSKRASRLQEKIRHQVRFEPAFEESVLVDVGSVGGVPLLRTKPSDRQPL